MRWEERGSLKQTTGNQDAAFIDQGVDLSVLSDIQCAFIAPLLLFSALLKQGRAFLQVTWIFIHPSIRCPPRVFCFSPPSLTTLPILIWAYVLNGTGLSNKFTALWRGSYPHFSSAWPSESGSFYPPSHTHTHTHTHTYTHTHTHTLSLSVSTHTHTQ